MGTEDFIESVFAVSADGVFTFLVALAMFLVVMLVVFLGCVVLFVVVFAMCMCFLKIPDSEDAETDIILEKV